MLRAFGLLNLIRFRLRLFTLGQMFRHASRSLGARVQPLVMSDGRLAIDVDDKVSLEMAKSIMADPSGANAHEPA